jgi:hypothetical protein
MNPHQTGRSNAVELDGAPPQTEPARLEREAILVTRTNRGRRTRRAALGLLLNRVKRMRIREKTQVEIICGDKVYSHADIIALLDSRQYDDWLSAPRALGIAPLRLWTKGA